MYLCCGWLKEHLILAATLVLRRKIKESNPDRKWHFYLAQQLIGSGNRNVIIYYKHIFALIIIEDQLTQSFSITSS